MYIIFKTKRFQSLVKTSVKSSNDNIHHKFIKNTQLKIISSSPAIRPTITFPRINRLKIINPRPVIVFFRKKKVCKGRYTETNDEKREKYSSPHSTQAAAQSVLLARGQKRGLHILDKNWEAA